MARKHDDILERYGSHRPTPADSHIRVDEIEDWLLVPVMRTRDSGIAEESNFKAASELLEEACGPEDRENGWEIHRFEHWGPGWYEIIVVEPGSKAQKVAEDIAKRLEQYPLLNEDDVGEREHEETIENIKSEGKLDDDVAGKVCNWLWEHDPGAVEASDGHGGYPSKKQINKALVALGIVPEDEVDALHDYLKAEDKRKEFSNDDLWAIAEWLAKHRAKEVLDDEGFDSDDMHEALRHVRAEQSRAPHRKQMPLFKNGKKR